MPDIIIIIILTEYIFINNSASVEEGRSYVEVIVDLKTAQE